jgi:hypothetical protein
MIRGLPFANLCTGFDWVERAVAAFAVCSVDVNGLRNRRPLGTLLEKKSVVMGAIRMLI